MKSARVGRGILASAVTTVGLVLPARAQDVPPRVSSEQVMSWMEDLSNWGRWGPDDQLGTLNFITPEKRKEAAALVQDGVAVSLARDMSKEVTPENGDPLEHELRWLEGRIGWGMDSYAFNYHGYDFSHVDALPHTGVEGQLYNGYSTESVRETGAEKLGIEVMRDGMFTRGVLIDLPRLRGVPYLEPGTAVTVEELEAWERETGVTIEPGDVVLIRTGRWIKRAQDGPWRAGSLLAGLHASTAP